MENTYQSSPAQKTGFAAIITAFIIAGVAYGLIAYQYASIFGHFENTALQTEMVLLMPVLMLAVVSLFLIRTVRGERQRIASSGGDASGASFMSLAVITGVRGRNARSAH